jgi:hypothetical protein
LRGEMEADSDHESHIELEMEVDPPKKARGRPRKIRRGVSNSNMHDDNGNSSRAPSTPSLGTTTPGTPSATSLVDISSIGDELMDVLTDTIGSDHEGHFSTDAAISGAMATTTMEDADNSLDEIELLRPPLERRDGQTKPNSYCILDDLGMDQDMFVLLIIYWFQDLTITTYLQQSGAFHV